MERISRNNIVTLQLLIIDYHTSNFLSNYKCDLLRIHFVSLTQLMTKKAFRKMETRASNTLLINLKNLKLYIFSVLIILNENSKAYPKLTLK